MKIITLVTLQFWILENDDVTGSARILWRQYEKKTENWQWIFSRFPRRSRNIWQTGSEYFPKSEFVFQLFASIKTQICKNRTKLPVQTLTFFVFKIRIPLDVTCCKHFGRSPNSKEIQENHKWSHKKERTFGHLI